MLHFAAARPHGRGALLQLLLETRLNVGYRDELYRTARDVAAQAANPDNIRDIDRWVLHLAAHGETQRLTELLLEGYDHLVDVEDDDGASIVAVADERKQHETLELLESIPAFEVRAPEHTMVVMRHADSTGYFLRPRLSGLVAGVAFGGFDERAALRRAQDRREQLHAALRRGDAGAAAELLSGREGGAAMLAAAKNAFGRCSLHIAVLRQDASSVELIASRFPHTLRKGRQPSYYFMNKSDILRLQEDEEALSV
ncbi:uncharacterized protein GBIM_03799 [Gryllus bimaculatus]|nr:uncharacterized protein GBIM_03799 [Gryllus bimaculatus]